MKIIITESQLKYFIRRRAKCIENWIERLENGDIIMPLLPATLDWPSYKIILIAYALNHCGTNVTRYDEEKFNSVEKEFGDRLLNWYVNEKNRTTK